MQTKNTVYEHNRTLYNQTPDVTSSRYMKTNTGFFVTTDFADECRFYKLDIGNKLS